MEQLLYSNNQILFYGKSYLLNGLIKRTKKTIHKIISDHKKTLVLLEFSFINDEELLNINIDSLNHDYYTDIITFDYCSNNTLEGDIYISTDRVKENSVTYKKRINEELLRVIFHGVLHLVGYKDKSKKDTILMREKEEYYIAYFKSLTNVPRGTLKRK